ncbi:MAG: FAD:protein FMN transferase [Oscillibacter sp.]|nr:FAD:protein FMN transferase [Oscillibacter sp.]
MKKKRYALPFLLLLCTLTACGRISKPVQSTLDFFAMDTVMTFSAYADKSLLEGARDIVMGIESRASTTLESSEVYALNRDGGGTVSAETAALLDTALTMCRATDGAFDVSIYPVVRAWGFTTGEYRVPSFDETAALLEHVDYARIRLDGQSVTLPEGMEIDLGGVAKGYAGREAASYLREHGVTSGLLNLGGNVQTVGSKPDGSPWRVAIRDPDDAQSYAGVVEIRDKAAVTSGGYERYFEENGETYWHIMNPATGRPARNGVVSATVIADDGALCDALSTALFVMGPEKAERFWRSYGGFDMILITDDGETIVTPGLAYTPTDSAPYTLRTLEE